MSLAVYEIRLAFLEKSLTGGKVVQSLLSTRMTNHALILLLEQLSFGPGLERIEVFQIRDVRSREAPVRMTRSDLGFVSDSYIPKLR